MTQNSLAADKAGRKGIYNAARYISELRARVRFFQGALALYSRANNTEKKTNNNQKTRMKNDDNKRHIRH